MHTRTSNLIRSSPRSVNFSLFHRSLPLVRVNGSSCSPMGIRLSFWFAFLRGNLRVRCKVSHAHEIARSADFFVGHNSSAILSTTPTPSTICMLIVRVCAWRILI
ncbi:unnamed protein product [Calicophoron daubneyi]|uniref:Uncharacterized protein n=1 Tax=Calicophoron daubneyi TaxID=300641 RepID=A0AAV2T945_CALDB